MWITSNTIPKKIFEVGFVFKHLRMDRVPNIKSFQHDLVHFFSVHSQFGFPGGNFPNHMTENLEVSVEFSFTGFGLISPELGD